MKFEVKKFKQFTDKTGSLLPIYKSKHLKNFNLKRFFFVYGKLSYPRADHAHKKCNQILVPIFGRLEVEITRRNKKTTKYILSSKNKKMLYVPKGNWIKLKFKIKNSILLTLCDFDYDKKEYIQSKKEFFVK